MKLKNLFFVPFLFVFAFSLNSCKKDNNKGAVTDTTATEAQAQTNDQVMYTSEADDATDDMSAALDADGGSVNARVAGGGIKFPFSLPCDATVAVDTTSAVHSVTLTYAGSNCSGKRTRSGSVVASFAPGFKWASAGAQLTITFNNLKITRVSDGKSVVINGTRTLTNTSGGLLRNLASLDSIVHNISDVNMTVTFDNGSQRTWQNTRKRVFSYDDGIVISITGSGSGVNRFGHNFTTFITAPMVIKQNCDFRLTSGQLQYAGSLVTSITTFGLDATGAAVSDCPASLYYKIVWTGVSGVNQTYIGSY